MTRLLRWAPLLFFAVLIVSFGFLSPRFLAPQNLGAILVQSSWLIVVALGMNVVLLTAGVYLSVGSAMYLVAVAVGLGLPQASVGVSLVAALLVGGAFGAMNAIAIVRLGLPA